MTTRRTPSPVRHPGETDLLPGERLVADAFRSGSCVRRPHPGRRERDGTAYHKGHEIRFYATSEGEALLLARSITAAGLRAGRPYLKRAGRWIVPLYGREQVDRVLTWVGATATAAGRSVSSDALRA